MKHIAMAVALIVFICFAMNAVSAGEVDEFIDAAAKGDMAKVQTLLSKNPGLIKAQEKDFGRSALMRAVEGGFRDMAEYLITAGAEVNAKDKDAMTALTYAAMWNHREIVLLLITRGADINAQDSMAMTPLIYAASNGHQATVELLLAKGADVRVKAKDGKTALKWAEEGGYKDMAELLRRHGAKE
jgi:ankyrin repeat protein